jgi:hypothetical protein
LVGFEWSEWIGVGAEPPAVRQRSALAKYQVDAASYFKNPLLVGRDVLTGAVCLHDVSPF